MNRLLFIAVLTGCIANTAFGGLPAEVKFTTFLGGSGYDDAIAVAAGPDGRIYVTGSTDVRDIPAGSTHEFGPAGGDDFFVARLAPDNNSIEFVTYVGGSDRDTPFDIAIDSNGAIIVTGWSASADFPVLNAAQTTFRGGGIYNQDGVVFKLTPDGDGMVYSTYIGGTDVDTAELVGNEWGRALHIDADGNAWVTGETGATDFPVTQIYNGRSCLANETNAVSPLVSDAWIAKISPTGQLMLSTCIGGSVRDVGRDIYVDSAGDIYLNGHTRADDFPITPGAYQEVRAGEASSAGYDIFVMKLDPTVSTPYYSTYIGASDIEYSQRSSVRDDGSILMVGSTYSPDFPVSPDAFQSVHGGGGSDALLLELSADGSQLLFASFFGGAASEDGVGMAIDELGRRHIVGRILQPVARHSNDDPELLRLQRARSGDPASDAAFVATFDDDGPVLFAPLDGMQAENGGFRVAIGDRGQVWASGRTESADFPVLNGFQTTLNGTADGFLVRLSLDADGDDVSDDLDNCQLIANTSQRDTNGDGFGNACDPDLNNDCQTDFLDVGIFKQVFLTADPDADFNGDGAVDFLDLAVLKRYFLAAPGPSANDCAPAL